jgi:hypothetical protein
LWQLALSVTLSNTYTHIHVSSSVRKRTVPTDGGRLSATLRDHTLMFRFPSVWPNIAVAILEVNGLS